MCFWSIDKVLSRISLIHLPLQIALRGKFGQKKTENIPEAKEKKKKRKHVQDVFPTTSL